MRLDAFDAGEPFALLGPGFGGPGFGGGRFLLARGLRATAQADPALVFAPFETSGTRACVFSIEQLEPVAIELESPQVLDPQLEAEGYAQAIAAIRAAIARGDVYQVCYTVRARLPALSGAALLSTMCARGVPRFAAWARLPGGEEIVSASPELFFEVQDRCVHTQPMKGTARPEAGQAFVLSAKEQCELAMITDLLRNDLAPVCRPRTVRVANERHVLELPYALQAVSDIVGELAEGNAALEVLAALHPGGSVTGAPKQAALAMIGALEPEPRGAYCGALGLCVGASSTFALLIRTAQQTPDGWTYGVGGGVVYDSSAEGELAEIKVKLGALGDEAG